MIYTTEDYEKKLVGAILSDTSLIEQLKLKSDQLQGKVYKNVLQAIIELNKANQTIDIISVFEKVKNRTNVTISDLSNFSTAAIDVTSKTFDTLQSILLEASQKQNLKVELTKALQNISNGSNIEEVKSNLKSFIEHSEVVEEKGVKLNELHNMVMLDVESKMNGENLGMKTGLTILDELLVGGFKKKNFYIIGARPAVGKTAFSTELALRLSDENKGAFFSIEMGNLEVGARIEANLSGVLLKKISDGSISGNEIDKLLDTGTLLEHKKLTIYDSAYMTFEKLERICRQIKREEGLDFIVIDYIQKMGLEERTQSERDRITKISDGLQKLSKKLDIAVICLAQLNRDVEKRSDNTPMASDLKESGQIEQDANVIILLNNPLDSEGYEIENLLQVNIVKNRGGQCGTFKLSYNKSIQRFSNTSTR